MTRSNGVAATFRVVIMIKETQGDSPDFDFACSFFQTEQAGSP